AAGPRARAPRPSPRGPSSTPRRSAPASPRRHLLLDMHLDPTVLEPHGEGVPLLDLGGARDDVAVHPFGDRINALERRDRAEQVQAPADRPKPVPLTADLARA